MKIAMGFNSLTTTTHLPNYNLSSSGQHVTVRLSARNVSVAGGNRAQDPLVRDSTYNPPTRSLRINFFFSVLFGLQYAAEISPIF